MKTHGSSRLEMNRRRFVGFFGAAGLGSTLMPGALAAVAQDRATITVEMIRAAAGIAGLSFTAEEESSILERLNAERSPVARFDELRTVELGNSVPLALVFNPVPPGKHIDAAGDSYLRPSPVEISMPGSDEELAFLPVTHLAKLIERRDISSTDLTKLYLSRLKTHDAKLHCVVNLAEEIALKQARRADEEIARGTYRGPLHGIPWGAKDLLAIKGTKTTWGASPYRDRRIEVDATVYSKLTEAGAVLVAKLTMGALAQGDRWFGGRTRNPWNTEQGSSGSSAGPGSATAAGLVGFSIGTETRGSIISPSTRNGVTGLRPTYGRVSRYGAMALSWTMDKIGAMCRSAEDCALVFAAIHGPDGKDNTLHDVPFRWDGSADVTKLKVGYLRSAFEEEIEDDPENPERVERQRQTRRNNEASLRAIRGLGVEVVPFELPEFRTRDIGFILTTESAAAFDDLMRSKKDLMMKEPPEESRWPDTFRAARFVPAVEYLQANRVRMQIIEAMDEAFGDFDLFVGSDLGLTNLTGHPEVSMPDGFFQGSPTSLRFTGKLFGEAEILLLARAFQGATDHHLKHPTL